MLHGFVQSGKIFSSKTGGLRKSLKKMGYELYYPTAPLTVDKQMIKKLHRSENEDGKEEIDIASEFSTSNTTDDLNGWYIRDGPGLSDFKVEQITLDYLHDYVVQNGPFEGLVGFSQGAGLAGYLLTNFNGILNLSPEQQPPLKFFISFSGFKFEPKRFQKSYIKKVSVPSLHVQGELDTVVTEARSGALFDCFEENSRALLKHPGGHFVPNSKPFVMQVCGWIQSVMSPESNKDSLSSSQEREKPDLDEDLLSMIDSIGKV